MGIRDNNIDHVRQRLFIPYMEFAGYVEATDTFQSDDSGNPIPASVVGGLAGLAIAATNDSVAHTMAFPSYFDITKVIGVRARWCVVGTVALSDTVRWAFVYDQVDDGEVMVEPATALNTTIAIQSPTITTTLAAYRSPRGIINAGTFDEAALDGLFTFAISAITTGFSANEVHLLGVELDYLPKLTLGGVNDTLESRQ